MEFIVLPIAIAFIIVATLRFKLHPVLSLTAAAIFAGIGLGMNADELLKTLTDGFGKTLSSIGLIIAFGAIIGVFLERTGATHVLAQTIVKSIGLKRSPLALNFAGFFISIPVYCDSGYVILSSLNKPLSKKTGIPKLVFAIALATGLYSAHVFVPPTPGPLAAAAMVKADLGMVLLLGLLVAIPTSLTGYFWARFVGTKLEVTTESGNTSDQTALLSTNDVQPKPLYAFIPILVPIALIALRSIADYPTHPFGTDLPYHFCMAIGNPVMALFIGVFLAFPLAKNTTKSVQTSGWVADAMKQAGGIVLITGAGGGFGAVIRTMDIASLIDLSATSGVGGLLLCFGIAAILKTAQGSSTVAIITAAAIVTPLLEAFGLVDTMDRVLVVLAIGAGAMTVSHINDSYFWVVSQFSGMDLKTALKGHTAATCLQGLVAIGLIVVLYLFL